MNEQTYAGRASLSKQEAIEAWKQEHLDGKSRIATAIRFNVSDKTLYRMYKTYGLPIQKRRRKKDHA